MTMLEQDAFATDAVAEAISVLEDDPCLNAGMTCSPGHCKNSLDDLSCTGHGSNLTLDGTVECDAAIMDGEDEAFGSVGAVSGDYFSFRDTKETSFV